MCKISVTSKIYSIFHICAKMTLFSRFGTWPISGTPPPGPPGGGVQNIFGDYLKCPYMEVTWSKFHQNRSGGGVRVSIIYGFGLLNLLHKRRNIGTKSHFAISNHEG